MKAFSMRLTHHSSGVDAGLAVYHQKWDHRNFAGVLKREFPNGIIRRTWVDDSGRAIMTGWFNYNWYN